MSLDDFVEEFWEVGVHAVGAQDTHPDSVLFSAMFISANGSEVFLLAEMDVLDGYKDAKVAGLAYRNGLPIWEVCTLSKLWERHNGLHLELRSFPKSGSARTGQFDEDTCIRA